MLTAAQDILFTLRSPPASDQGVNCHTWTSASLSFCSKRFFTVKSLSQNKPRRLNLNYVPKQHTKLNVYYTQYAIRQL
jgi:hypothetical protein